MLSFVFFLVFLVIFFLVQTKLELTMYQHRGHAQPDDPDQENPDIVTDATDGAAHLQINRGRHTKDSKEDSKD